MEQLHAVLRTEFPALRHTPPHIHQLRPRRQAGEVRHTALALRRQRTGRPQVRHRQVADPRQDLRARPRRERRQPHRHRRPALGLPRGRRRLPLARGNSTARGRRHHHHQPAVLALPRVPAVDHRRRQAVLHHRKHERYNLQGGVPADKGQQGVAGSDRQRLRHGVRRS